VTASTSPKRAGGLAAGHPTAPMPEHGGLRALLDRYVRAWETADVAGLVALLREDAVVSMPPDVSVRGRGAIGAFLRERVFAGRRIRLHEVRANGGPAYVIYSGAAAGAVLEPYAVLALDLQDGVIAGMLVFAEPRTVARFGGPAQLPA